MVTKKLKSVVFAWDPNAFSGKGYWYVLGSKGGLGRAASKTERLSLGKPSDKDVLPESPKVYEPSEESESDKSDGKKKSKKEKREEHEYGKAEAIRKTSIGDLIAKNLVEGKGIGESFKGGVTDKIKAIGTGIKEKFDPMNMAKSIGGNLGAALYGKARGRSQEDIEYFTGMEKEEPKKKKKSYDKVDKKGKKKNKNPLNTTIGAGSRPLPLRKNDSVSDVAAKLFSLLRKSYDDKKLQMELDKNFEDERKEEAARRHKEFIKALLALTGGVDPADGKSNTDKNSSGIINTLLETLGAGAIFNKIWHAVKGVLKMIPGLKNLKFLQESAEDAKVVAESAEGAKVVAEGAEGAKVVAEGAKGTAEVIKGGAEAAKAVSTASKASKVLGAAKGVLEFLGKIPGLTLIAAGAGLIADVGEAIANFQEGKINEMQLKKAVTEALGSAMGGLGGAELGGLLGAAAGSAFPIVGNIIGAAAGGIGGFFGGEFLGKKAAGLLFDYFENTDPEQLKQEIDNIKPIAAPKSKETPTAPPAESTPAAQNKTLPAAAPENKPLPTGVNLQDNESRPSKPLPTGVNLQDNESRPSKPLPMPMSNALGDRMSSAMNENNSMQNDVPVAPQAISLNNSKVFNSKGKDQSFTFDSAEVRNQDMTLNRIQKTFVRYV